MDFLPFIVFLVVCVILWAGARKYGPAFDNWLMRHHLLPQPPAALPVSESVIACQKAVERIRSAHSRLASGEDIPDSELIEMINELSARLQSNCESVGNQLMSAIGGILIHRPQLVDRLLPLPMRPYYCWGMNDGKNVVAYLEYILNTDQSTDVYTPEARKYIQLMLGPERAHFEARIDAIFKQFEREA